MVQVSQTVIVVGLGEVGNPGLGGAIANAVCDALASGDLAIAALPLTPSRVFAAARLGPRADSPPSGT